MEERKTIKTEEMIIDDLHEGVRELGAITNDSDTTTRFGDKAVSAIRRLERAIPSVKGKISTWKNGVGTHARDAGETLDQYAHEKPWQLVGVAAAVGLFLGLLFSSDSDRD